MRRGFARLVLVWAATAWLAGTLFAHGYAAAVEQDVRQELWCWQFANAAVESRYGRHWRRDAK